MEIWTFIPGYKGVYSVSNKGRVKSHTRLRKTKSNGTCEVCERLMRLTLNSRGYLVVGLSKEGIRRQYGVHQLVLTSFVGPCPEKMECCHRDGNPKNNNLRNLYWGTRKQNGADKVKHGRSLVGEKHPRVRFSESDIITIRRLWKLGEKQTVIANNYKVSQGHISDIVLRKIWKHI